MGNQALRFREFLDEKVQAYNQPAFIQDDPVCIPHLFSSIQDREISGLFAAVFAWGNRSTIINKSRELMQRMDMSPYAFVLHHSESDLRRLSGFRHRTFQETDLLYFVEFLHQHYSQHHSLESAFSGWMLPEDTNTERALTGFERTFFSLPHVPGRTRKHISTPARKSSCKRLNMYLRWMVRHDDRGVDLGLWRHIRASQLVCPVDLHVSRVARRFGLLERQQVDWQAALELTDYLKQLDPLDPVKYDFALFGLGVVEKFR